MSEGLNVLSLFDGIGTGKIALERAGVKVNKYFSSEIDKYAIIVNKANNPDVIHLGDVREIKIENLPKIDLVIGGSPCQNFAFCGKQKGMCTNENIEVVALKQYLELKEDNFVFEGQSYLFWEYMRLLSQLQSENTDVKFLLENVRMPAKWENVLSKAIGVKPLFINSALVSGQMRQRYYWTNIPNVTVPEDRHISFQSILESDEARIPKAYACTATYYKKGAEATRQRNFLKSQRPIAWIDDKNTRWLTPLEFERLQTLPDNYTNHVSNTQRLKAIGNGWTVAVITHIFKGLLK